MTRIKADCPSCGPVRFGVDDVVLRICQSDGTVTYRFGCPACGLQVDHPAGPRIFALLNDAGVRTESWSWPAEVGERPDGPPFTHDDLLDFHLLLAGDGWRALLSH